MKKYLILALLLVMCGCVAVFSGPTTTPLTTQSDEFDCHNPKGIEYWCYSPDECGQYFAGYGAVVVDRIYHQRYKGWYPNVDIHVVHVNVIAEYDKGWHYVGKISAKQAGEDKIWMKFELSIFDRDCNLLHHGEREGFLTQMKPEKEKKDYEQNSFKLQAFGK